MEPLSNLTINNQSFEIVDKRNRNRAYWLSNGVLEELDIRLRDASNEGNLCKIESSNMNTKNTYTGSEIGPALLDNGIFSSQIYTIPTYNYVDTTLYGTVTEVRNITKIYGYSGETFIYLLSSDGSDASFKINEVRIIAE